MQRWFFPAWNGDFRLEAEGEACVLKTHEATPAELAQLRAFLADAVQRKWIKKKAAALSPTGRLELKASVAEAGKALLRRVRSNPATLTAVRGSGGKVSVLDGEGAEASAAAIDALLREDASAAVSVARPTPCCPDCVPGSIGPASEVLLSFLSPAEHEAWARHRQLVVTGGLSGHRYLLSHRHHPRAVRDGRICFDLDGELSLTRPTLRDQGYVLKFHDWSVPPEEEVLAAKLILEHREPWLRNEATLAHVMTEWAAEPIFKNPFGNLQDGTLDASATAAFGGGLMGLALRYAAGFQ